MLQEEKTHFKLVSRFSESKPMCTFPRGRVLSPETTKSRKTAKASRNKKERSNKEQTTRAPLDERIGVRNMDVDMKQREKKCKRMCKNGCVREV